MPAYRDHCDGRWRYLKVVKLPDGRRVKISGTPAINTKVVAEADERGEIARIVVGGGKRREVPVLEELLQEFLESYAKVQNKPSEQKTKRSVFRVHLVPAFGRKRLNEIDGEAIDKFRARSSTRASRRSRSITTSRSWIELSSSASSRRLL